jgi:hypothetical protein
MNQRQTLKKIPRRVDPSFAPRLVYEAFCFTFINAIAYPVINDAYPVINDAYPVINDAYPVINDAYPVINDATVFLFSLQGLIEASRRGCHSYHDQRYYSHVTYEMTGKDNTRYLARLRLIPLDEIPETGLLSRTDQAQVW